MVRLLLLLLLLAVSAQTPARAQRQMVAAAHPLAAEAGMAMLRAGGGAIDAAIAAGAMLGLVEPQSSGLGGGALMLHWDAAERRLAAWDGREVAPAAAPPGLFLRDGQPCPSSMPQSAAGPSACRGRCACWRRRIGRMASCPGRSSSSRPSLPPRRASA
ncbi:gamma-glutamyltransferase [Siccirubricoccus deserti]